MELTEQANTFWGIAPKLITNAKVYYVRIYRIAGCTRVIENWIQQGFINR